MDNVGNGVLNDISRVTICKENGEVIATITADKVEVADGYLVKLLPSLEDCVITSPF